MLKSETETRLTRPIRYSSDDITLACNSHYLSVELPVDVLFCGLIFRKLRHRREMFPLSERKHETKGTVAQKHPCRSTFNYFHTRKVLVVEQIWTKIVHFVIKA